jgi:hypothetical protein
VREIFAVQAIRVKKSRTGLFERNSVLGLIALGLFGVPIEHELCIYEMRVAHKEEFD